MRIPSKIRISSGFLPFHDNIKNTGKTAGKKAGLTLLFAFLLFFTGFFSVFLYHAAPSFLADASYNRLCREIFRNELSGNTLTLHYTLKNPADYGIYDHEAHLPVYSSENRALSQAAVTDWLGRALGYRPETAFRRKSVQLYAAHPLSDAAAVPLGLQLLRGTTLTGQRYAADAPGPFL